jgi:hypothetical protein
VKVTEERLDVYILRGIAGAGNRSSQSAESEKHVKLLVRGLKRVIPTAEWARSNIGDECGARFHPIVFTLSGRDHRECGARSPGDHRGRREQGSEDKLGRAVCRASPHRRWVSFD